MSHKQRRVFWPVLVLAIASLSAWAFISGRPRALRSYAEKKSVEAPRQQPSTQAQAGKPKGVGPRNLSLQPEAFKMSRRLGGRFAASKRSKSVLIGALTIGSERRTVQTIRTQTDDGEQVEIKIAGQGSLTWDRSQGALSSSSRASGSDRELIERLVLDSPDQFVLAQLRGAGYYTVSYNVRPVDAGDNYAGPLWNIVRITDPEPDEAKRPQSRWRLYYLNVTTGLIDRIESEVAGQRMLATISSWTDLNGEKVPTQITWTRQGQTLMHYSLNNFSHGEK